MPNFYEILGLTAGVAPERVKTAFHTLAKSSHPDVNASDVTAAKRFKEINEAYEILSDPEKRAVYDLGLRHERAETRWRFWNTMVVTTASFTIVVGCGLYFWLHHGGRPFAHAHETTRVVTNSNRSTPKPKRDNLPERGERSAAASSTELSDGVGSGRASGVPPVEFERVLASAPSSRVATEPLVPRDPVSVVETGKVTVAIATSDPSPPAPIPQVAREQAPPTAEPSVEVGPSMPTTHQPEKSTATTGTLGPAPSTRDAQAELERALHL